MKFDVRTWAILVGPDNLLSGQSRHGGTTGKPEACEHRSRWLRPAGRHHRNTSPFGSDPEGIADSATPSGVGIVSTQKPVVSPVAGSTTGYGADKPPAYVKTFAGNPERVASTQPRVGAAAPTLGFLPLGSNPEGVEAGGPPLGTAAATTEGKAGDGVARTSAFPDGVWERGGRGTVERGEPGNRGTK